MFKRTALWLLPLSLLAVLLAVRFGREYLRRNESVCLRSESAQSCYRRGVGFAAEALDSTRSMKDREKRKTLAVGLMGESCRRNHAPACNGLARQLLIRHPGDLTVRRQAADLYEKGCSARSPSRAACHWLGEAYAYALGREHDQHQALRYFEKACGLGHATACYRAAGRIRAREDLGPWRSSRVRALARTACERGSMTGCLERASTLDRELRTTTPEAYGREAYENGRAFALATYTRACDAYFFIGCHNLGRLYQDTVLEIQPDTARARLLYERACFTDRVMIRDRGRSLSCAALGDLLLRPGAPTARVDTSRVDTLYRMSCDMLAPEGCVALAQLRARDGASREILERSVELAATACVQRNADGCALAAELYERPGMRNPDAVARFHRRSCDLRDASACLAVANTPRETPRDSLDQMFKYYRRACALDAKLCQPLRVEVMRMPACGGLGAACPRREADRSRVAGWGAVSGSLTPGDAAMAEDRSRYDEWVFRATGRERIRVTLRATGFDGFLSVGWPQDGKFAEFWSNDDLAEGATDAQVLVVSPRSRDLVMRVNTFGPEQAGDYLLLVERAP